MWLGYATQIMKVVHVSFYNKKAKNASDFIFSRSSSGQTYACNEPFDRFFFWWGNQRTFNEDNLTTMKFSLNAQFNKRPIKSLTMNEALWLDSLDG